MRTFRNWLHALTAVLGTLLAMAVTAALGLAAAGATGLPAGAYPRVVEAAVVAAVGGALTLDGHAGDLAGSRAGLTLMPLSVTLVGALVLGAAFRRHARTVRPAAHAARIAVLWLPALLALALTAHHTFEVPLGEGTLGDLGELFGLTPEVGFTTDVPVTVLFGMLWLAGVLALAVAVSRTVPLPRPLEGARPAAYAMVGLLLAYVAIGAVIALVVAGTRGQPARTLAVVLLGLPNVVWPVFTLGLGATWHGRVDGPFGLPMPHLLDEVLRAPDVSTLNLTTLARHDGRVWWLVAVDAVLVLSAAYVAAVRSPARTPLWRHAVRTAVALALTVLAVCLTARISAHYGLSLIGIGDLGGGLSGVLFLRPEPWSAVGLALGWGLVAGLLGGLAARRVRGHRST
ncbi:MULTISPECIES: streptophobe family protein [unclassified Streptomyces]|uniref:streptophobe family protein n=1 Tax=unclassified Streptomyces TaxID=2593676 RepID=UPI0004BE6721|nr:MULTISPECIES: streptophobe family protein [unclassified Streptomyces]